MARDQWVKLWEPATGKELLKIRNRDYAVRAIAFNRDGSTLGVVGGNGCLFRGITGPGGGETSYPQDLWCIAFGGTGSGCEHGMGTGEISGVRFGRYVKAHAGAVLNVKYSADYAVFASAGADGTMKLFRPKSWDELHSWTAHTKAIRSIAFSPKGGLIATGSEDGTVKLWDVESAQEKKTLDGQQAVTSVAFSPDGSRIAFASTDHFVHVRDVLTGEPIHKLELRSQRK